MVGTCELGPDAMKLICHHSSGEDMLQLLDSKGSPGTRQRGRVKGDKGGM